MNKGDAIVIERVANGWMVRPQTGPHDILCWAHCHVFQFLDYDQQGVTSALTLYGFLREHFA